MAAPPELILLPSLKACPGPNGGLVLTQKFVNGVAEYARYWPGRVTALMEIDDAMTSDMDHVEVHPQAGDFGFERRPGDPDAEAERLSRAAAVLAFLGPREVATAHTCRRLGVPLIYSSEYSVRTELQIIAATVRNPLRRARRVAWTLNTERARRSALKLAAGIQCSGTPTYEVYRHVSDNALLFFDNRVPEAEVITEAELAEKLQTLSAPRPLRLVFGGRLIAMKGALELPKVALRLRQLGVAFQLDIYGAGDQEARLRAEIARLGLGSHVHLRGVVDFSSGWVPYLKSTPDLFVCCHPQGDPSSTYPEVMACGLPIAGYDNEAFRGIVSHAQCGWLVAMGDADALATRIAELDRDRATIAEHARKARNFALQHAFERTFRARLEHIARAAGLTPKA